MHSHARRTVLTAIKVALALAILCYLVVQARGAFAELSKKTIEWRFLAAALLFSLVTAALSFVRWHILIRALGLGVRLVDSLRLGALGFALNFVSPGSIGGDFFKAVFLAHGHPGRRTEAVASVVADRILGLLTMLAIASCGIIATGLFNAASEPLRVLSNTILFTTAIGWLGFGLLMVVPALSGVWMCGRAEIVPVVGKTIARLLGSVQIYRGRTLMLLSAFGVSVLMTICFVTTFYLVALGLPGPEPTWSQHLVIVPVAGMVGAIPITPSGLGTTEAVVEKLYEVMPSNNEIANGDGTLVALGRRATDIAVALVGLGFYLSHRREVQEVFAEAEEAADHE